MTEQVGASSVLLRTREVRTWRLVPAIPIAVLTLVTLAALLAPLLTSYDPVRNDLAVRLHPPAWIEGGGTDHLLGTDAFGRDVFTRLLYGARVSLSVAVLALLLAVLVGTTVGVISGYLGGTFDSVMMRLVDALLALPSIIVALTFSVALGPSFRNVVLVLGLLTWPDIARLIRGETLSLRKREFVTYAVAIGVPRWVVLLRHVVPNVMPTVLVATTLQVGHVILAEASLSFLGAGVPQPMASWGGMVSDGQALIATGWWTALFPGLAITATVLCFNSLGDWLRDRFDPKLRLP